MKYLIIFLLSLSAYGETVTSPNMSLPVPVVGTTPGPAWANNINSCMSIIDSHDHTPGYGVQIPPNGLNINASLPMGNNSLTGTKSIGFQTQTSLSSTQNIYSSGGDLYYNDASGNVVRITQNGNVTGATGTITGLPSGTASASYQSASGTFQFQSSTSTPANISGASYLIQQQTTSPNGITIQSPNSLSAAYSLTLPTGLPAVTSFLIESAAGVFSNRAITNPTIQKFTSGTSNYTTPSGVLYIHVRLVGGGGGGGGSGTAGGGTGGTGVVSYFRVGASPDLLVANGGGGGKWADNSIAGGSASLGSGPIGTAVSGGTGTAGSGVTATSNPTGGPGCSSPYGGGGGGTIGNVNGVAAIANTGSGGGGGGGGSASASFGGGGGSCGGYVDAIINNPSATYAYSVGTGGAAGSVGTSGTTGGAGATGYIEVWEFYQ